MLREVELAEPGGSGRTAGGSGAVDGEEVEVEDDDVRLLPAALEMPLGAGGQSSSFWSNLRASLREEPLLMQTLVGVIVGVCIGSIARACDPSPTTVELVAFPGELFMRVLRGLVIPLVSVSMVCGVLSLFDKTNGTNGGAKRVAFRLMLAYLVTTLVACAIGLLVVHAVRPGDGVSLQMGRDCGAKVERTVPSPATQRSGGALASVLTTARAAVPSNVFNALNEGNVLGIITASLFFGTAIASVDGNSTKDVVTLFHALDKIIQLCVKWATQLMPIGVSSIVAGRISGTCDPTQMLSALGKYVFCILLGLGAHAAVALPGMYVVATSTRFSRVFFSTRNRGGARNAGNASQHPPPPSFLQVIKAGVPSFATAFAVDSSSVALPKTIACAMSLGVPESLAKFSLPLGATVNMNGTALYEALSVLFIAQCHGVELSFGETVVVTLTSTIAAVGAAAIPSAGLVTMLLVLQAAGLAEFSDDVGALLALDWFLDRCRTVVNVQGDLMVVTALAAWEAGEESGEVRETVSVREETRRGATGVESRI